MRSIVNDLLTFGTSSVAIILSLFVIVRELLAKNKFEEIQNNCFNNLKTIQNKLLSEFEKETEIILEKNYETFKDINKGFELINSDIDKIMQKTEDIEEFISLINKNQKNEIEKLTKELREKEIIISKQIQKIKRLKNDSVNR